MLEIISNLFNSILNIVDAQQKQINDLKEQLKAFVAYAACHIKQSFRMAKIIVL